MSCAVQGLPTDQSLFAHASVLTKLFEVLRQEIKQDWGSLSGRTGSAWEDVQPPLAPCPGTLVSPWTACFVKMRSKNQPGRSLIRAEWLLRTADGLAWYQRQRRTCHFNYAHLGRHILPEVRFLATVYHPRCFSINPSSAGDCSGLFYRDVLGIRNCVQIQIACLEHSFATRDEYRRLRSPIRHRGAALLDDACMNQASKNSKLWDIVFAP